MNRIPYSHILIILFTMLFVPNVCAQTTDNGNVRFIEDHRISSLVEKHKAIHEVHQTIPGFRIQIFFDSGNQSKSKASRVYDDFLMKYPQVPVYLTFKAPNYKVRVGDFRTRLEAQHFLRSVANEFPDAWVISDEINLPPIEPVSIETPQ